MNCPTHSAMFRSNSGQQLDELSPTNEQASSQAIFRMTIQQVVVERSTNQSDTGIYVSDSNVDISIATLARSLPLRGAPSEAKAVAELRLSELYYVAEDYDRATDWLRRSQSTALQCGAEKIARETTYDIASIHALEGDGLTGLSAISEMRAKVADVNDFSIDEFYFMAQYLRLSGLSDYAQRLHSYVIECAAQGKGPSQLHHVADSYASLAAIALQSSLPRANTRAMGLPRLGEHDNNELALRRRVREAQRLLQEARRLPLSPSPMRSDIAMFINELEHTSEFVLNGPQRSLLAGRAMLETARRLGLRTALQRIGHAVGCMHLELGHADEAVNCVSQAAAGARKMRRFSIESEYQYTLAEALHAARQHERALLSYAQYVSSATLLNKRRSELRQAFLSFLDANPALARVARPISVAAGAPQTMSLAKRAAHTMAAKLESTLTSKELAAQFNVTVRALELAFRREYGASPMAYLRRLRLQKVRDALLQPGADEPNIATVARRYGFPHPSTLIRAYRVEFGELPSQTLRSAKSLA